MRDFRRSTIPSSSVLITLLFLAAQVIAQNGGGIPSNLPKLSDSVTSSAASQTQSSQSAQTNTASTITSAPSVPSGLPVLSTSTAYDGITDAPPVEGNYKYPAPTVPPTAMAPFMNKSSLPSGTVFIGVGAALGFLFALVIAWRALVAWSLHRSVRRSNALNAKTHLYGGHAGDADKPMLRHAGIPFYTDGPGSTVSLDNLAASGKSKGRKGHTPTGSLFFSPTAGVGMHTPGSRGSSYLPAGYYAAGNAAPAGGAGVTYLGAGSRPLSMVDLGPQRHGYQRARSQAPSPPRSPSLPPSRGGVVDVPYGVRGSQNQASRNSFLPGQERAPSALLDDMFELFPPNEGQQGPEPRAYNHR